LIRRLWHARLKMQRTDDYSAKRKRIGKGKSAVQRPCESGGLTIYNFQKSK